MIGYPVGQDVLGVPLTKTTTRHNRQRKNPTAEAAKLGLVQVVLVLTPFDCAVASRGR